MAIVWVCVCVRMSVHVGAYFGGGVGGHFSSASFQLLAQEIPAFGIPLFTVG